MLALVGFVGLCLLVAVSAGAVTQTSVRTWFLTLTRPAGTPPNWVFGPVWTTLYVLMGVAAWRVWRVPGTRPLLRLWGWQLLANAAWTPVFFGLHQLALGLLVILVLLALVALTIRAFRRADRPAAGMLVPYFAWVSFATYLNAGFWWLNGGAGIFAA